MYSRLVTDSFSSCPKSFPAPLYFKDLAAPHLLGEKRETKISVYLPASSGDETTQQLTPAGEIVATFV